MARADDIADALLMQAITLAQLEAGEQARVQQRLLPFWRRVRTQVAVDDPTAPPTLAGRLRRVKDLVTTITALAHEVFSGIATTHATVRAAIARWVASATRQALQGIGEGALMAQELSERTIERVAETGLILGASATDWWRRQEATVERAIGDRLRQAVLHEQPLTAVLADLTGTQTTAVRAADALVQTSLTSVQQQTTARLVEAQGRRIGTLVWRTTLDARACLICIALSGQVWTRDHQPLTGAAWPGEPPIHWRCRCVLSVVPPGEAPATDLAFEPWLRTRPASEQRAILGPGRYTLWQAGTLRLPQLVDQRHRPLTLEALQSESAA